MGKDVRSSTLKSATAMLGIKNEDESYYKELQCQMIERSHIHDEENIEITITE